MASLSADEFKERSVVAEAFLADVGDWMRFEAAQRVCNRSFGEMTVSLTWEDGVVKYVKVNGAHTIKSDKRSRLPSSSVDAAI